jgi:ABC-type transport system involved in multi-copper enzyme maturation permease subunit
VGFAFLFDKASASRGGVPSTLELAAATAVLVLLGLYAVHMMASFLALFLSVAAVSGELDGGTLQAILARPIRRADYLAGRWLAFLAIISTYVIVMVGALLWIARVISGYEAPDVPRAVAVMILSAALLSTISLAGSTVFSTLANGVFVFSLFGLAWLAGIIEFIGGMTNQASLVNIGIAVSLLVPSDALWRGASFYFESAAAQIVMASAASAMPFASTSPPAPALIVWSVIYIVAAFATGARMLGRRDL